MYWYSALYKDVCRDDDDTDYNNDDCDDYDDGDDGGGGGGEKNHGKRNNIDCDNGKSIS
jgi:hypothetical protein